MSLQGHAGATTVRVQPLESYFSGVALRGDEFIRRSGWECSASLSPDPDFWEASSRTWAGISTWHWTMAR